MRITRREFLVGCSTAIAAMAGSRINHIAFGDLEGGTNQEILITIFLRGGCDAINLIPPIAGEDRGYYEAARPDLLIPTAGADAALSLDGQFGLHPAAVAIYDLYQDNKLAVIHAVGMNEDTRSHFDAMDYMELGTPGSKSTTNGWLTRHLQSATNLPPDIVVPSLMMGNLQPTSMLGNRGGIGMSSPGSFNLNTGHWQWRSAQRTVLRQLYESAGTALHQAGTQALDAVDIVETYITETYTPANGAVYPSGGFGDQLQVVAQMIKLQLGLRTVTLDLGGWDTHESQSDYGNGATGYFANLVQQLSEGLTALYTDLDGAGSENYTQRLTVVVMSEFGRRLRGNADRGTDHGHGGMMLVLGGNVNGGLYGEWPGLHNEQLYDGADLAVTTDYRQILSEILIRRLANPNLGVIFPGYAGYAPLGIVQGEDLPPIYTGGPNAIYLPLVMR